MVVGQEYEVLAENERRWQTDYTLKGVEGEFNSVWFDEVRSKKSKYMALAHKVPVVGERCECTKVEVFNGRTNLIRWITTTVKEVTHLGENIYQVTTRNSVYIVQVG